MSENYEPSIYKKGLPGHLQKRAAAAALRRRARKRQFDPNGAQPPSRRNGGYQRFRGQKHKSGGPKFGSNPPITRPVVPPDGSTPQFPGPGQKGPVDRVPRGTRRFPLNPSNPNNRDNQLGIPQLPVGAPKQIPGAPSGDATRRAALLALQRRKAAAKNK